MRKLESLGKTLVFVYEAGPCGFVIYRFLRTRAHQCWVVAPSLTPRQGSDCVKTDRRDSLKLARLARAGELRRSTFRMRPMKRCAIWYTSAKTRSSCSARRGSGWRHCCCNDIRYAGKSAWTKAHRRWIASQKLPHAAQQVAFEEYVQAVQEATARVERLEQAIIAERAHWRWLPLAHALEAFRGIQTIHATRIVAELGDLRRFSHPRSLMGYLGLVPSENSSGPRRRQGAITKAGNSSARRAFIEAAWAYQHNARVSWVTARRQTELPQPVIDLAWKAQLRLCARYRRLCARGLNRNKIVVAIARELAGFVWVAGQNIKPV